MPEISIIIPVYNGKKFIAEAINSVLRQTHKDYEIIVVDDGSTDDSGKVLEQFGDKIRYFYQQNKGISSARNMAIKEAKGEYIALLDQDDVWYPRRLEKQIEVFKIKPDTGMVYSTCYCINEKNEILYKLPYNHKLCSGWVFKDLIFETFIPVPTVLIKKSVLDEVGFFNEKYSYAEESELFLRISRLYKIECIDEPLAAYRIHCQNLSRNKEKNLDEDIMLKEEMMKIYPKETLPIQNSLRLNLAKQYYKAGLLYLGLRKRNTAQEKFLKSIKNYKYSYKQFLYYFLTTIGILQYKKSNLNSPKGNL